MGEKNNLVLKVSSKTDLNCFVDFYKLNLKRNKKAILSNIFVIWGIWVFTNVAIGVFVSNFSNFFINMAIFALVFLVGGSLLLYMKSPIKQYRKYPELGETVYCYEFFHNEAAITINNSSQRKKVYQYETFANIYDTSVGFYFFTRDNLSFILSKESLSQDEQVLLSGFLADKPAYVKF